ncbi:FAD-dependent thymidylate synthase [bacterium]|nr:FAD-dependent thymidylate synthase [bacterium]
MGEFKVKLIGNPSQAQTLAVAAALGCFDEKSASQILDELLKLPKEERLKKERVMLKNSFGRGHGSVGDQVHFTFNIENVPRITTLFLCSAEYLEHLQQSFRRAKASRGFYLPEAVKNSALANKARKLLSRTFDLYEKGCGGGIPAEDARFVLPLYAKTNITTTGNARELCHISSMAHRPGVPRVSTEVVDEMINQASNVAPYLFEDYGFNYEVLSWYPSSQLFALENPTLKNLINSSQKDPTMPRLLGWMSPFKITPKTLKQAVRGRDEAELANLKHLHFEFLVPMSLVCFHQATRQRTWNQSVESIYEAAQDAISHPEERMIIPPSIKNSAFASEYKKLYFSLLNLYKELTKQGIAKSEAVGVLPHCLKIYDWVHINGWNAIHSIGKRTCTKAQWEIRFIAKKIAKDIKKAIPAFQDWAEPQCITYGKCPEIRDCGYYRKKNRQ